MIPSHMAHLAFFKHNGGGVLWFHVGRPCVRLYAFSFAYDNLNNFQ